MTSEATALQLALPVQHQDHKSQVSTAEVVVTRRADMTATCTLQLLRNGQKACPDSEVRHRKRASLTPILSSLSFQKIRTFWRRASMVINHVLTADNRRSISMPNEHAMVRSAQRFEHHFQHRRGSSLGRTRACARNNISKPSKLSGTPFRLNPQLAEALVGSQLAFNLRKNAICGTSAWQAKTREQPRRSNHRCSQLIRYSRRDKRYAIGSCITANGSFGRHPTQQESMSSNHIQTKLITITKTTVLSARRLKPLP